MRKRNWLTPSHRTRTDLAVAFPALKRISLLAVCFAWGTFLALGQGKAAIEGTVQLSKSRFAPVENERYEIVSKAGVLATEPPRAIVYLAGRFRGSARLPTKTVAQKDLAFLPALLAIEVGTKVEFPNEDDTYHNIFSYSPTKRFDLGRYPPEEDPPPSVVFDKPGLVTLRCDIHEHMRGLILVLESPHFAITDAQGRFRLPNLPAGHYILKAWVSSKTTLQHPVELKNGTTLHVDLP